MRVTIDDVKEYGFIIVSLFSINYPDGTTLEQMKSDAETNGWIRSIIQRLEHKLSDNESEVTDNE